MPREIITIQCGQCGNQVGCRFWELALKEHAACNTRAIFDFALSSFFRNVDSRHDPPLHLGVGAGNIPIHTLKARAILIDMEENVINGLMKGHMSDLFESRQLIAGTSGSGNNWSHGYGNYGPCYANAIQDKIRREVEWCDSPQSFFLLHSLGGGTGSGLGSYIMEMLHDAYPELYRFTTSIYPSVDDDVVTSPYNSVLSTASLIEHVDCVLPIENQALFDIVRRKELRASFPNSTTGKSKCNSQVFDSMNEVVADLLLHLTSSVRFEGCLNVDLNEVTSNLVPYPKLHFLLSSMAPLYLNLDKMMHQAQGMDQLFNEVFSKENQLLKVNPTASTYLGCALLLRGSSCNISHLSQNASRIRHRLKMTHWNMESFKMGICHQPAAHKQLSLLCLANNTSFRTKLTSMKINFAKLYKKRFFVHHYTEYVDSSYFETCSEQLDQLIDEYSTLEFAKAPESIMRFKPILLHC